MKIIYEREYGDGCVLRIKELPHPHCDVMVPAIEFAMGGGKGITAYLSDLAGEEFTEDLLFALTEYVNSRKAEDIKDALKIVDSKGSN